MNVVEAIDAWIDERIDDLTDDELEEILEILDAVSASEFADLETTHVYNDDIYMLVEQVGGDRARQEHTEDILRASIFGDPLPSDLFTDTASESEAADTELDDVVTIGAVEAEAANTERAVQDDDDQSTTEAADTELDDVVTIDAVEPDAANTERAVQDDDDQSTTEAADTELDDVVTIDAVEPDAANTERAVQDDEAFDHVVIIGGESALVEDSQDAQTQAAVDSVDAEDHAPTDEAEPDGEDQPADDREDARETTAEADHHEQSVDASETTAEAAKDDEDSPGGEDLTPIDDEDPTGHEDEGSASHDEDPIGHEDDSPIHNDEDLTGHEDEGSASHDHDFLADVARASAADDQAHHDFLSDVAKVENGRSAAPLAPPLVVLREGDDLGPSFLDATPEPARTTSGAWKRWAVAIFMIAGLAVFVFGSFQLVGSLSETEQAGSTAAPSPTPAPVDQSAAAAPTNVPDSEPAESSSADASTDSEPAETSSTDPDPAIDDEPVPTADSPELIAIRLVSGDVVLANVADGEIALPQDMVVIYDASDDDLLPSRSVSWLGSVLGIIDADGSVLVVDPEERNPDPELVYEAGGGLGEAREIAAANGAIALRTVDGDVTLVPDGGRADPDSVEFLWDASEEDAEAVSMSAFEDLVPIALDNGDVQLVDISDDNTVAEIWSATDEPSAFNVLASETGVLLSIGQGAVARYFFDDETTGFVWEEAQDQDAALPAIGYASAGERTALVLGDGTIVVVSDRGVGPRVWDPTETEIRALAVAGGPRHTIVLLENGSVVRIPLTLNQPIDSIWDITDETLSPANQVALRTAAASE